MYRRRFSKVLLHSVTILLVLSLSSVCGSTSTAILRRVHLSKSTGDIDQVVPLPSGGLLVRDTDLLVQQRQTLEVYDGSGRFARKIGKFGPAPGSYQALKSIAVARDGTIWVADLLGRISFFEPQGRLLGTKLIQEPGLQVEGIALDEARGFFYLSGCLPTRTYVELGCRTIHQYRMKDKKYLRSFHENDPDIQQKNLLSFSDNQLDVDSQGIVWAVDAPVMKLSRIDPRTGQVQRFPVRSAVAKAVQKLNLDAGAEALNTLHDKSYLLDRVLVAGGQVVVSIRNPKGIGWLLATFDPQGRQLTMDLKAPGMPVGKTKDGHLLFASPAKGGFELAESALPEVGGAAQARR